jgi:microcystin-dependent protein
VLPFAGSTIPPGFLLCDGSAVSQTTYPDLFTAIGITYGGSGSTFNLPDMRGIFPKGAGTTNRPAGKDASGNSYAGVLGTYATDMMQGHKVFIATANTGTPSYIPLSTSNSAQQSWVYDSYFSAYMLQGDNEIPTVGLSSGPTADASNGIPRIGHTTEPQSLGLNFIIKY